MTDKVEAVVVTGEPVPESAFDMALLGTPSLVTLKHDTEGDTMKVRIIRACNTWLEGDTPEVNAHYGRQLIANGLAEEIRGGKPAPLGKSASN
ncbi:hypothetical protein [Sphingomonas sp.]|jgi:hypothetical protein|uniref:hypothetical protein n=1 Tax=Sphingomonas sp. TaxID=28214 RepID=UPI002D7EA773|nr:hypothetical protein [Sphingomonas sp.]HEU0045237.1 hypothetical protein [Sphingomonas sp.]